MSAFCHASRLARQLGRLVTPLLMLMAAELRLSERAFAAETGFPGLEIYTHEDQDNIARDFAGLRLTGQITHGLAEALEAALFQEGSPRYARTMLELDSEGGDLAATEEAVALLLKLRGVSALSTRVMDRGICASGCIALYMTGTVRKASTASMWVFHGACPANSNVPSVTATARYLGLLEDLGVKPAFICNLTQEGYVTSPGALILSGYELFHNHDSGIITELLPNWRPETPQGAIVPR
ncbi:MAG: hypothetical protein IOC86_00255 [Aestuariivirga sp.]|nr:hypothetical protein [Aestuariivirga sp.]